MYTINCTIDTCTCVCGSRTHNRFISNITIHVHASNSTMPIYKFISNSCSNYRVVELLWQSSYYNAPITCNMYTYNNYRNILE